MSVLWIALLQSFGLLLWWAPGADGSWFTPTWRGLLFVPFSAAYLVTAVSLVAERYSRLAAERRTEELGVRAKLWEISARSGSDAQKLRTLRDEWKKRATEGATADGLRGLAYGDGDKDNVRRTLLEYSMEAHAIAKTIEERQSGVARNEA